MPATVAQAENTGNHFQQLDETLLVTLRNVVVNIAYGALLPSKPRPSAVKVNDFAIQVALVMTGIRSGYLVDALSLRFDYLTRFLEELRLKAPSDLAVCWDPSTEQTFFVNAPLLWSRIHLKDFPLWVSVAQPPCLISEPAFLGPLLEQLTLEAGSITKLQLEKDSDGCSLAAFILEYPVAYVVAEGSSPFLSDVSLCIYKCTFDSLGERLPIVQFSIPAECDTEEISSPLRNKFQQRIGKQISITCIIRMFDRVAL